VLFKVQLTAVTLWRCHGNSASNSLATDGAEDGWEDCIPRGKP